MGSSQPDAEFLMGEADRAPFPHKSMNEPHHGMQNPSSPLPNTQKMTTHLAHDKNNHAKNNDDDVILRYFLKSANDKTVLAKIQHRKHSTEEAIIAMSIS